MSGISADSQIGTSLLRYPGQPRCAGPKALEICLEKEDHY